MPSCVAKIETALKAAKSVAEPKVYFNSGKVEVQHAPDFPDLVTTGDLMKTVKSVGYEARECLLTAKSANSSTFSPNCATMQTSEYILRCFYE